MADVETQVEEETCCEPSCCSDDVKATELSADELREAVSERYGRIAEGYEGSCCGSPTDKAGAASMRMGYSEEDVTDIPEGANMGLGCGNPQAIANLKAGETVVDLGSGGGFDCFLSAKAVGETGQIIGVDMTPVMIRKARGNAEKINAQNVTFRLGEIEYPPVADNTADVIISNCVINLSPDKDAVLREAWRVLKPGGELYFSDVYSERRVPESLVKDPLLYGECLSGALYWNDFLTLAKRNGFADPRLVEDRPLTIDNPKIEEKLGPHRFFSATYRLFKIPELEESCEDFGQAVIYKGTVEHHPDCFVLDKSHIFQSGKVEPVCGNSWLMLHQSRFAEHFEFIGNWDAHYGIFDGCGTTMPFDIDVDQQQRSDGGSCC